MMRLINTFLKSSAPSLRPLLLFILFPALAIQHTLVQADIVDLAVGSSQICLLDDEQNLRCKTRTHSARLLPPESTPALTSIAAGNVHLCGLTTSGGVYCFGDDDFGQTSHESVTLDHEYIDISAGGNMTCATRSSGLEIDCWGDVSEQLPSSLDEYLRTEADTFVENIKFTVLGSRNICWGASINSLIAENSRDSLRCWEIGRGFYQVLDVFGVSISDMSNDDKLHCVIDSSGAISCLEDLGFARLFRNASFDSSGPYAQVAVSGSVVCVLTTVGQLDCDTSFYEGDSPGREERRIAEAIHAQVNELAGTRFTDIEPHHVYFNNGGRAFCLTDFQSELHCLGGDIFNELSLSEENSEWIDTGTLSESSTASGAVPIINNIAVYSHGIVELFWQPSVDFNDYSHVEIYRDGELLTTTSNADSFFDNTLQGSTSYSYKIRRIATDGTAEGFSASYTVTTPRDYTIIDWGVPDSTIDCDGGILPAPVALEVRSYGRTVGELFWEKNAYPTRLGVHFNIFINGTLINAEPLEINGSFYLYGEDVFDSSYQYSLNAVDGCGRVSEMSNVVSL